MMYDWDYKANFVGATLLTHPACRFFKQTEHAAEPMEFPPAAISVGTLQAKTRAEALKQLKVKLGDPLPPDLVLTRLV